MTETILFPDLFAAITPWLQTRLAARGITATVTYRIPNPMPATLVRVSSVGGVRLNIHQRQSRLLIEAWNQNDPVAARVADWASAEIEAACRSQSPIAPGVWIMADPEDFSVPVGFADPITGIPRYQFYCNLVLTGSVT
jgi:hypothetical protein